MSGTLAALFGLGGVRRSRLALGSTIAAMTVLFGVGLMATAGYLISRAAERPAVLSLMVAIVAVRFFGLGRPALRYLERLVSHDAALRVLGHTRETFYRRIEPLAPTQLDSYRRGDLLSRMVADVDAMQDLQLRVVTPPLVALVAGAVSVGVAAAVLPAAALVLAAGLLVGGLAVPALGGSLGKWAGQRQAPARGELAAEVVELVRGAQELAVFGAAEARLSRSQAADRVLVKLAHRGALAAGAADGLGLVITGLTVAGVLAVAVEASGQGHLDRVLVALLALLALASFEAIAPLGDAARQVSATLTAGRRILALTDQKPAVGEPDDPIPAPEWPFAVALESVQARYPGQPHLALDGESLRLEPGERVALVGVSGAGKTTITNLLLRFLDPEAGRVTVAGRDLRDYRQRDIRRAVSVAGQESHIFSATVRDNLRVADPAANDREIEQVLRRARVWDLVCGLPAGLDTFLGEGGQDLSGGQRQRLVIARALLAGAPVLVLDEPTAHLDPSTASELVEDVFSATTGQTVLLITHRTEGLELVDRVITLSTTSPNLDRELSRPDQSLKLETR